MDTKHIIEELRKNKTVFKELLENLSAKMIFKNWLAHDYLHIRQIIRLKFEYLKGFTGENLSYAGDW
jgi:uncharacterized protein YutE (UPF0331/DUF86 family)